MDKKLIEVCRHFRIPGEYQFCEEIKVGNVNKTYKVTFEGPDPQYPGKTRRKSYIVQSVNTFAFKNPVQVMDNVDKVTEYIRAKDPDRCALHFHHTHDRKTYIFDKSGFWRLFNFIPSVTYSATDNLRVIRNAGRAFGDFQMMLSDFDAAQLNETIPEFHNTRKRYEQLEEQVAADPVGRVQEVREEIAWLQSVKEQACKLTQLQLDGVLPLRVTHNDTKINNVLFDAETDDALVVIDLDTVMPGLVGHDFGDAVRFAANLVEEDSAEPEKAGVNMDIFRAFAGGFLSKTAKSLTQPEIDTLALSCFVLTCELAVRFLADYIAGDVYFKTNYAEHNLVRTRCQIALAKDMLQKLPQMEKIIRECVEKL
ncbi:MAG: aminoglycoside phosphotransferase family protein [Oscillospiraceae bacterium]|nr:aminoglycoside phosphotransferase family protein [Oscillospiraceae bacterium]